MNNNKALIALTVVGGSLAAWGGFQFLKSQQQVDSGSIVIPEEKLIAFLKELKSQCFPHFYLVASIMERAKAESKSEEEFAIVKEKIIPEVEMLFEKKQSMVIIKHDLTKENLTNNLESSRSRQVKELEKDFGKLYNQALLGISPVINLTEQTTQKFQAKDVLHIVDQVLRQSVRAISQAIDLINQQQGVTEERLALDQPLFIKLLCQVGLVENKRKVYIDNAVNQFEEPTSPTEVFSKLTQYHKQQDAKFKLALNNIEDQFEVIIQKLLNRKISSAEVEELLDKIDAQATIKQFI